MRESLIELIGDAQCEWLNEGYEHTTNKCLAEYVADELLAKGITVSPVWPGSTVYYIYDILGEWCMQEMRVTLCTFDEQGLYSLRAKSLNGNQDLSFVRHHPYYNFGVLRFTKEEAEKALAERNKKE